MGSLYLVIFAVAVFVGSALNTPMHGSAEDVYDYQSIRASPKVQCDSTDMSCIEGFIEHHRSEEADNRNTNLPENKLNFLSLITGKDFIGTEMEKRKDYPETEFKSHYLPSCACQSKYEPLDLGYNNFPRYLMSAVCLNREDSSRKCWRGSRCREVPFKVHVLSHRTNQDILKDERFDDDARTSSMLPDSLRSMWRVRIVTVAATCQCTQ
ncbi:prothoracicotropic hormone-like isoform X2 [Phlebotomus papatasi]|uniref:prothoracicotropic hormone-like isoform X2 n=1 Tax=Phlebotomus papatasi TaxID=29031 RepID=UPI002483886C|nr:prothoracicotropic hormone-like isoform X2 [Phlebotomus papatasi]